MTRLFSECIRDYDCTLKIPSRFDTYGLVWGLEFTNTPEYYLGPNWKTVIDFLNFYESQPEEALQNYEDFLNKHEKTSYTSFGTWICSLKYLECFCLNNFILTPEMNGYLFHSMGLAYGPVCEIIAMHKFIELGEPFVFLPLFESMCQS